MSQLTHTLEATFLPVRKMRQPLSVLLFGIPTAVLFFSFHALQPWLRQIGLTPFEALVVTLTLPFAFLAVAATVGYAVVEKRPLSLAQLRQRLWFPKMTWRDWGWGLLILGISILAMGVTRPLTLWLIDSGWLALPGDVPLIFQPRPGYGDPATVEAFYGGSPNGRWSLVVIYAIMLFFNIVGEELWWRGFILPRQVAAHGRWAWLLHGLLWTSFHVFKWWDLLNVLVLSLLTPWVSQRTRSNWPAVISHSVANLFAFVVLILQVME